MANWLPRESHSCLKTRVSVLMSARPSAGQVVVEVEVEVEGFCRDTSEELTPFSAKEPEGRQKKHLTGYSSHFI